ncbi:MAG: flagellar motor switch phosphatase FliY [Candidatus Sericytochromatia bacterium]|nr:flagellar motor switch phosphatase FliY [Candidatus Sericytochromatia bacterium]
MSESTPGGLGGPLTESERKSFSDLSSYALGAAASTMTMLLNKTVALAVEEVSEIEPVALGAEHPAPAVLVTLDLQTGSDHPHLFVMQPADAAVVCDLMMGGEGTSPAADLDEAQLSAIGEAFNQGLGNAANTLSTLMLRRVTITPPRVTVGPIASHAGLQTLAAGGTLTLVRHRFTLEGLVDSVLLELVPHHSARELVEILVMAADNPEVAQAAGQVGGPVGASQVAASPAPAAPPAPPAASAWAEAAEATVPRSAVADIAPSAVAAATGGGLPPMGLTATGPAAALAGTFPQQDPVSVKAAQFAPLTRQAGGEGLSGLDLILDVTLKVTVELGRTKMQIREVLDLGKGSVVELDKLAGEPVDMLVNGKLIAKGEVVVIDENFGIRLTEIVSPQERFNSLNLK